MVQLGESLQHEVMLPQEGGQALFEWVQQTTTSRWKPSPKVRPTNCLWSRNFAYDSRTCMHSFTFLVIAFLMLAFLLTKTSALSCVGGRSVSV